MPRIFTAEPNKLTLFDNISNSEIVLFYRTPTSKEVAAYSNGMTKRIRNKVITCVGENRQKHGLEVLVGFREGDFILPKNGQNITIASDQSSQNYDPEWKSLIKKFAPDLVDAVAIHVFENTSDRADMDELSGEVDGSGEAGELTDPNS